MKRRFDIFLVSILVLAAGAVRAETRMLTLAEALDAARKQQPALAVVRANTAAAEARVKQQLAPMLPQVSANISYARQMSNHGAVGNAFQPAAGNVAKSYDFYHYSNMGLSVNQLVWDFGTAWWRYNAAKLTVESSRETESTQMSNVVLAVRTAFFTAAANKALVEIAEENQAAQQRHMQEIEGFVKAGARPEIDLAQVRADLANATLQLVNARSAYETSKAVLNQAMGVEQGTDFDVADDKLDPLADEEAPEQTLIDRAVEARPELHALAKQAEAQSKQISAIKGNFGPILGVSTSFNDIDLVAWNWNIVMATLTWPVFQGGLTRAQVRETQAARSATRAQLEVQRQQVRLEVSQARLKLVGAKASVEAAGEVLANAGERLRLADERYRTGVGAIIELQDAQVAFAQARSMLVQAEFNVSLARSELAKALGRE